MATELLSKFELRHLVLVSSFLCNSITCGICYANSAYYYGHWLEEFQADKGLTAAVGSLSMGIPLILGPLSSIITNAIGFRLTIAIGGLICCAGLFCAAHCSNIYTLLTSYGGVYGAGIGITLSPSCVAVSYYFEDKYHGIVLAIAGAGVGVGQCLTPIIAEILTDVYTWRGSLIVQAAITLNICVCGAVLRPLPGMTSTKSTGGLLQLSIFQNLNFNMLLLNCVLLAAGISVSYIHIGYSVERMSDGNSSLATKTVAVLGIAGGLGRFVHSPLVKLPTVNSMRYYMTSLTLAGIALTLFPLAQEFYSAVACSFLIGFLIAVYGSTQIILIIQLVELKYTLTACAWVNLACGIGMLSGGPIAGALYDATGKYAFSMYFGGASTILSALILVRTGWRWKQNKYFATIPIDKPKDCEIENELDFV